MSNVIVKAALNNLADIKIFFNTYATKGKAGEVGNPFWSLYQGEDTKGHRVGYNWHLSDPVKSWELLELNLKPYENTGGTFLLTMSDKAKDNAPSVFKLIDFNPYRNMQPYGVNGGINGIYTGGGIAGSDLQTAIAKELEVAMLRRDLEDLKNKKQTAIGAVLQPFTSHPNFNPNAFFNGLFAFGSALIKGNFANGIPQYTAQQGQEQEQQQAQQTPPTEQTEVYEYNNEELLYGLEKIRARVQGVRPEILLMRLGDGIETMNELQLNYILESLNIKKDIETGLYCAIEQQKQQVEQPKATL